MKFETIQVRAGYEPDDTNATTVPLHQSVAYTFNDAGHAARLFALQQEGNIYSRLTNPTNAVLEKRIAALEGGIGALVTASGHGAQLLALTSLMIQGDNFVSSPYLYGGSFNQFKVSFRRFGFDARFAADNEAASFEKLIDGRTKFLYVETIGNPSYAVPDFAALSALARKHDLPLVVDNTFGAGGWFCRPIEHGADVLVESTTKWIGGHATSLGGVIVDAGTYDWGNGKYPMLSEPSDSYHGLRFTEAFGRMAFLVMCRAEGLRDLGPSASPFNSWTILHGIETLSLRAQRQGENALALARYFAAHPKVERVNYPGLESDPQHANAKKYLRNGFGGVLSVVLKGDRAGTEAFVNSLALVMNVANVGDNRTMIVQPAATTHAQLNEIEQRAAGVEPTALRISVGIEHIDDLIADFNAAFKAVSV